MDLATALALAHAAATCVLAGLVWTVQLVVYPDFRQAGPSASWPAVHAAHVRPSGRAADRLIGTNWWRTAAWTGAAACGLALLA